MSKFWLYFCLVKPAIEKDVDNANYFNWKKTRIMVAFAYDLITNLNMNIFL